MYKFQINMYLNNGIRDANEIYDNLSDLKNNKNRITRQDKEKIYENLSDLYNYFSNGSLFSFDANISRAFANYEQSDQEIAALKTKYELESKKFLASYLQLGAMLDQLSREFESYLLIAKRFIKEMDDLKYTYINDEDVGKIKSEYWNLMIYLNDGLNKIEEFNEVEKLYKNLNNNVAHWRLSKGVLEQINDFVIRLNFLDNTYIVKRTIDEFKANYIEAFEYVKKSPEFVEMNGNVKYFYSVYINLDEEVENRNTIYIDTELKNNEALFNDIDGKSLDHQQRLAVVTDEMSNLIIAGAGAGKTLTIAAKVKYLVEIKGIKIEDILLISFTNKSLMEMQDRIVNKLNLNVECMTFHKLGVNIISNESGIKPNISSIKMEQVINKYMNEEIFNNEKIIKNLVEYFGYYINIPPDWEKFETLAEKHEFDKSLDLNTIKGKLQEEKYLNDNIEKLKKDLITIYGENVKSSEELIIANFLFLNGIKYTYEKSYEFKTGDLYHRQYKPDFFLDDYNIYIEHFGITEDNRVPWLTDIEAEKYIDSMEWKKKLHFEKGTKLIETYSYYNTKGILISELERKLKEEHVKFEKVDFIDIFNTLYINKKNNYFIELSKLISTFIGLANSNDYKPNDLEKMKEIEKGNLFIENRTRLFLDIVIPIFKYYEKFLLDEESIDFNDMINRATKIINNNGVEVSYKYIIIDEYQDISSGRQKLIKSIISKTDAKLMCVGDDYQSIYRFAGSDIGMFLNFEKYFGYYEELKIEKTYRNSQQLIDIAGEFIMKNENQISKKLISKKTNTLPIRIIGYSIDPVSALTNAIEDIVGRYGDESEVMLLGRNNFDINIIENNNLFHFKKNRQSDGLYLNFSKYPKLRIFFITVHSAKGLEAENVIIINGRNDLLGFPNKIADDPILSYLLTEPDHYPYGEERRLFYVALTRTKNDVFLLTPDAKVSEFIKELISCFNLEYEIDSSEKTIRENPNCPKCSEGKLLIRKNKNREFVGCSNYPQCDFTHKNTDILYKHIKCPTCGAYLTLRKGKKGNFYGCINYPKCSHTEDYFA